MSNKELSDLSIKREECIKCGAVWINGIHHWKTGRTYLNSEEDLAGLVCNKLGDNQCINPKKGAMGGDTWEKRMKEIEKLTKETSGD